MSTLAVNTITNAAGGNTAQINGMTPTADSLQGFRNRILNGGMVIDQRNAGASVTVNDLAIFYGVDRFRAVGQASSGVFTMQRVTDAPTGFTNSLRVTVTTADASISATDRYLLQQVIEGFNAADLGFGTASATAVTLSFWVKSSLTGSFGAALQNGTPDRSYPFTYTINAANTWEYKTVTIAGDTTGTWPTDNTGWGRVNWSIGSGSNTVSTAGSWQAANYEGVTGQTQIISTLSATWQVTGVQLEAGSVATPFERRPYGTELALCQRYYYQHANGEGQYIGAGWAYSASAVYLAIHFPVTMRSKPTALVSNFTDAYRFWVNGAGNAVNTFTTLTNGNVNTLTLVSAGLSGFTGGQAGGWYSELGSFIGFSSEL
jgi:hypothetical protein